MKPLPPAITDPEEALQERGSRFAALVFWTFVGLALLARHWRLLLFGLFFVLVLTATVLVTLHYFPT